MNDLSRKVVLVLLAIGATIVIVKIMGSFQEEPLKVNVKPVYKSVRVEQIVLGEHKAEVKFSGKLAAEEKIDLFTEVGGVLLTENFKEGNRFSKGAAIAQLNAVEFANGLKAQKTQLLTQVAGLMGDLKIDFSDSANEWEQFLNAIKVDMPLPVLPNLEDEKLKRFVAGKGVLNSYYTLKSQEEKLSKFTINAPFNGVLTQTSIQKGTLVRGGQKIGEFINPSSYELETEVSLSDLKFISKGSSVQLNSDDLNQSWKGIVSRINSSLDANSQMVTVYIKVVGQDLKEGMFLHGTAKGANFENTALINRKLLKNGGVFLVDSGIVSHHKVNVLYVNQAKAIISGLSADVKIVADNMKGLFNGMKVTETK
ncbi:MAG: membrane fusion protein (multidrug efflux system) [Flavobacteriales bacterium]|jgi:membrane fusion protein (multidrug efflux system)|tara:strand:- start:4637 stop:5740 length:1104 start_codon:yes stop_codon:yes gene_type:complete